MIRTLLGTDTMGYPRARMRRQLWPMLAWVLAVVAAVSPASGDVVIDPTTTDVTTENLFLAWSTSVPTNPEEVGILRWSRTPSAGGPTGANLTATSDLGLGPCDGLLEHFGNSWAPPDPQAGGTVLVGEGSTGTWSAGPGHKKVTIHSSAAGCPNSAGAPVVTTYQFWENAPFKAMAGPWQRIRVRREFSLTNFAPNACGPDTSCFRPYIPRLRMSPFAASTTFGQVLYPTPSATLASVILGFGNCPNGCSGAPAPGAAPLPAGPWDPAQGWFAINNPDTGEGLIVKRLSSTPADLWLDFDCDAFCSPDSTNASSILLLLPAGFTGTVVEEEHLCFYDATTWPAAKRAALTLPPGC
jgi:hypothetical protein